MSIAEDLIAHLSNGLAPADRAAFRQAAENALATSPVCLGPGSIHRTVTSIWRTYFRPPREDRATTWVSGKKKPSRLITEPPRDSRARRRVGLRWADHLVKNLKERINKGVNVVVASGPEITLRLATAATGTLPIVMVAFDYDPLAHGYIRTLARPGGNVTGLFVQQIEQAVKRLELMREVFPKAKTATVLWDELSFDQWQAVEKAAKTLGIRVIGIQLHEQSYDYERALADAPMEAIGLLLPMASPIFFIDRERLIVVALKHRMAMMFGVREMTEIGGLISYGVSLDGTMGRAAEYVDRIARGARPADLPVEQPTKFELVINLKTAKTLGVTIQPSLLARADEVIE